MAKTIRSDSTASSQGDEAAPMRPSSGKAWLWWGAAALSLILGFADLWRGGETIAPILLILGYVVLIPIAILSR